MKLIKKVITGLVMVISALYMVACDFNSNNNQNEDDTSLDRVMKIGCFNDPFVSEESYKTLAESGINRVFVNKTRSHSQVLKILEYCDNLNIDVVILAGINNKVLYNNDYMNHKSFAGVNIKDEPSASEYDGFAMKIDTFEQTYQDKLFYVNLFPNPMDNFAKLGTDSYEEYVELYCEKVLKKLSGEKVLSFDIYPLETYNDIGSIESRYLSNLECISTMAKLYDAEPQVYLQAMGYKRKRTPSLVDLNFQAYCSMAFGYKSFIYFCYYTPGPNSEFSEENYAIVDRNNQPTEIYDYVKSLNSEIFEFDNVYLSYNWQSTIPVYGDNNPDEQVSLSLMKNQDNKIGSILSASSTYDALVGYFTKGKKEAYMVTNFMEPSLSGTNEVTLNFKKAKKATVYLDGKPQEMSINSNTLTISLPVGEGAFIVVE